jgi:hypothetical protein
MGLRTTAAVFSSMPFIYAADLWCDSCGRSIRKQLRREGHALADSHDETSYDSDEFPKFAADSGEADCPQHCGAGEDCLESIELPSGRKIGALLSTEMTGEGARYTQEAIAAGGEVAELWAEEFAAYL